MPTYPLTSDEQRWKDIKATIGHDKDLNEELLRRIEQVSFGEVHVKNTDARGRLKLPKSEFAERENVEILVLDRGTEAADE